MSDEERPTLRLLSGQLDAGDEAPPTPEPEAPRGAEPPPPSGTRPKGEIWDGCPVAALGVHGETWFYLDYLGQLAAVTNHTKDRMRGIFGGRSDLLMKKFPQYTKGSTTATGWKQEDCATAMMSAAAEKGVWNAFERVRGLGAWPDGHGGVALHCGDSVLHGGRWHKPGQIEGYVYPSAPPIPRPLVDDPGGDPASQLVELLRTWSWARGDLDAWLLTGWICAAMFGGALDWRPLVWITGDAGTGKSTVQKVLRAVMGGEGAILQSTDATEPGIRQFLLQSTIPVALDELEAEADGRRSAAVIKLARQAASGGAVLRGGADHVGQEFRARSCFAFSSILIPQMLEQDISRIALLELRALSSGAKTPSIDPSHWATIGRGLRRRILLQWDRLDATLDLYRRALHRAGHAARGCDQYGTLLAMADLAAHDEVPDEERLAPWIERLDAVAIGDQTDQQPDWMRCLNHLFGQHIEPYRSGQRFPLGRWILSAAGLRDAPDPGAARDALPSYGIRVVGRGDVAELVMANSHPVLSTLYRDTRWGGSGGTSGVWAQAMKRVPGARATASAVRFDGVVSRAYTFRLTAIPGLFGDDGVSPPETHSELAPATPDGEDFA